MRIGFISGSTDVGCFYILGGDNKLHSVYAKTGGHCAYCGRPITIKEMQVDHLKSFTMGGASDESNYLPACPLCNRCKSAMDLEHFRKYIESDAPRIHFKKNRKWYADADRIVDAYHLKPGENEVIFYFEKGEK